MLGQPVCLSCKRFYMRNPLPDAMPAWLCPVCGGSDTKASALDIPLRVLDEIHENTPKGAPRDWGKPKDSK